MTRVAFVCADPGVPAFGTKGCSVHVQAVCEALLEAGCEVTALLARRGGSIPTRLSAVRVIDLPCPEVRDAGERELALAARNPVIGHALAAAGPFDLVYERAALWTSAPMAYAKQAGTPGVLEVNAPLVEEQARYRVLLHESLARRRFASALRAADVVAAVSREVADWAAVAGGRPGRVHVVPNGVDVRRFEAAGKCRPRDGRFVVGFVGTLKPWHGLDTLVTAFAEVAARVPSADLVIVGDGPERTRLAEAIAAHGLTSRITFAGAVTPDAVPGWLAAMDAAVAPYPALDGFYFSPLKVTEYMAAGLPVVASGIGQIADLIDHQRTGVLVPPGDAAALARALAALSANASWRESLGRAARAHVEAHCTWTAALDRVLTLARSSRPPNAGPSAGAHRSNSVAVVAGGTR